MSVGSLIYLSIIKDRLEMEGVECFVQNEGQVNVRGKIRLFVRENDLEKTTEILKESGYIKDGKFYPPNDEDTMYESAKDISKFLSKIWNRITNWIR